MKHTIRNVLLAGSALIALVGLTMYLVVFSPATASYEGELSVWIPPTADIDAVADSLEARGILRKRRSFLALARLSGWGNQIKAGHYRIKSGDSNHKILNIFRRGLQEPVRVSIPAGTRRGRIARAMATNMAFTEADARAVMADEEFALSLNTDTTGLLGYMLPDTYFFYWLTDVRDVVQRIKKEAENTVNRHRPVEITDPMSDDDVLVLASIIEWETSYVPEKATIAGVYLNRIRDGWPLQADPTVQYAVMQTEGEKRRLFNVDYKLEHPYNTYRFRGLPPGPVTNPSATSIEAVLNPEEHGYFYFVAKGDGSHLFSRTLSEHNLRAREYRAMMKVRRRMQAEASTNQGA